MRESEFQTTAILLAAGSGSRMKSEVKDKILFPLDGESVFLHVAKTFLSTGIFRQLQVVYRDEDQKKILQSEWERIAESVRQNVLVQWVPGGKTRQESVYHGMASLSPPCEYVFIHDCARPLVSQQDLIRLRETLQEVPAVALARPVTDTIKEIDNSDGSLRNCSLKDVPRDKLWAMETPQCFHFSSIFAAYQEVRKHNIPITDDTSAAERAGIPVTLLLPDSPNPKITYPQDIVWMEFLLRKKPPA